MKREDLLISVQLSYDTEYVMEIKDAYKFLDSLMEATVLEGYGNKKVKDITEAVVIKYITKQKLKEIQLAQALDTDK